MAFGTLLWLLSLAALRTGQAEERPLVNTKYEKLQGVTVPVKDTPRTVDAFFGIPFAKPPVGPLRYKNPEAPEPCNCIRDASQFPPMCLQYSKVNTESMKYYQSSFKIPPVSEDCLYLNVFTPSDRQKGLKLPVMVFIHGGGLVFWSASYFDGSALSAYEDLVVVSIQYRMGMLGFLSTDDGQLPGNLGLLDQNAALRWVQENIADFGGDPQHVTIFGESAGAVSVASHVLSPLSKGLFHRAIAQSGTMKMPGLVVNTPEELIAIREVVPKLFGCEPPSVLECLMQKSEEEILRVLEELNFLPLPICVDGVFLPKPVDKILDQKESNEVPFLLGVCNQEMGWFLLEIFHLNDVTEGMSRESMPEKLQDTPLMGFNSSTIPPIMEEYSEGVTDPFQLRDSLLDIIGDKLMVMPALRTAKSHRDSGNPVYFYEFQHRPSLFANSRPAYVKADHTDDLFYVFGGPFLRDGTVFAHEATDEEKLLARTMMRYWANFARNSDPNGPGLTEWPLYNAKEGYLGIDLKQKASFRLKEDKYQFWTKTLPEKCKRGDRSEL